MRRFIKSIASVTAAGVLFSTANFTWASSIRGIGTAALRGGDLTDPENNGDPENNINYNATFAASEEPTFGGAEAAFNVFDNQAQGGGNTKFCCGDQNNFPTNPITIDATFATSQVLRSFTITSGNDTPARDPLVWKIQGSNDGTNFFDIFSRNDTVNSVWTARDQVVEFSAGTDYTEPPAYSTIRFVTTATGLTTGARFQLDELEYFNTVPEPSAAFGLVGLAGMLLRRRRKATVLTDRS
jgi:alpha-L-fucosidase 2